MGERQRGEVCPRRILGKTPRADSENSRLELKFVKNYFKSEVASMETMTPAKVIRRVRKRIEVSQEGLARLLNATKGAVQHWERGRNNPDLARLNALRQLCPPGAERKELDALIKQTQSRLAPLPDFKPGELGKPGEGGADHRSSRRKLHLSPPREPQTAAPSDASGIIGAAPDRASADS